MKVLDGYPLEVRGRLCVRIARWEEGWRLSGHARRIRMFGTAGRF